MSGFYISYKIPHSLGAYHLRLIRYHTHCRDILRLGRISFGMGLQYATTPKSLVIFRSFISRDPPPRSVQETLSYYSIVKYTASTSFPSISFPAGEIINPFSSSTKSVFFRNHSFASSRVANKSREF